MGSSQASTEELKEACEGLNEEEAMAVMHHMTKMAAIHDAEDCERKV